MDIFFSKLNLQLLKLVNNIIYSLKLGKFEIIYDTMDFFGVSFVTKSSGTRDKFQLKGEAQKLYFINPSDGKWPHYRHYYRYTDKQ